MAATLQQLFRTLASFAPERRSLAGAPWEQYVDWAIAQGLGPLAAYNLEFNLGGGDAPAWARDRLLSVYQGSVTDNMMKLVGFKKAVDALQGRRMVMMGAISFAEGLYPHIGFRPVIDVQVLLRPQDLEGFANFLGGSALAPAPELERPAGSALLLSDGRTQVALYSGILGRGLEAEEAAIFERALPLRAYGESFFRLDLEDAILALCLEHAREGYLVPLLSFIDLRELLLGAPSMGGQYSRPLDFEALFARARAWRADRALYASTATAAELFPEVAGPAARAAERIPRATRALIDRLLVRPAGALARTRQIRGMDRLRRVLTGGR